MGYKSESGKGSLIRKDFNWKTFGQNYERLYYPRCKGCGSITTQRAGWVGRYYCTNKHCEYYEKIFRKTLRK